MANPKLTNNSREIGQEADKNKRMEPTGDFCQLEVAPAQQKLWAIKKAKSEDFAFFRTL